MLVRVWESVCVRERECSHTKASGHKEVGGVGCLRKQWTSNQLGGARSSERVACYYYYYI